MVQLCNRVWSIRSTVYRETFHPVVGPAAEADGLYVRQLNLPRFGTPPEGGWVIWDVGMGGAANALAVFRSMHGNEPIRMVSFDQTLEPLRFALQNAQMLGYLDGFEEPVVSLLREQRVVFQQRGRSVVWELHLGDFPSLMRQAMAESLSKPDALLFDAYSPRQNPEMWTLSLFIDIHRHRTGGQHLDPRHRASRLRDRPSGGGPDPQLPHRRLLQH